MKHLLIGKKDSSYVGVCGAKNASPSKFTTNLLWVTCLKCKRKFTTK